MLSFYIYIINNVLVSLLLIITHHLLAATTTATHLHLHSIHTYCLHNFIQF